MNERNEKTMTAHPYPEKVVEAVAKALWDTTPASEVLDWEDIQPEDTRNRRSVYLEKAEAALTALWEASRVDTMAQVDALPHGTLLHTSTGTFMAAGVMADRYRGTHLPAHVIYWGDRG